MTVTERQPIEALKAEIAFREKLSRQHVTGEVLLPDYYTKQEHDAIIIERAQATRQLMERLDERGIGLSPFVELGAERGQRAVVVCSDYGADGIAADLSYHQLRTMEHFAQLIGRDRLPMRVCCDANLLPFRSGAFPFVFAYQFLHHFPALHPIVSEIRRIMSGGYFYFDDEPFRRVLRLALYQRSAKMYSPDERRKNRFRRLLESFVSEEHTDEAEHGVIENDELDLREWRAALAAFDAFETRLMSIQNISSRMGGRLGLRNVPNWLLGGLMSGLCQKDGPAAEPPSDMTEALTCPVCLAAAREGEGGRREPRLVRAAGSLTCPDCGSTYPIRDEVIFLLPPPLLRELYPDVAAGTA